MQRNAWVNNVSYKVFVIVTFLFHFRFNIFISSAPNNIKISQFPDHHFFLWQRRSIRKTGLFAYTKEGGNKFFSLIYQRLIKLNKFLHRSGDTFPIISFIRCVNVCFTICTQHTYESIIFTGCRPSVHQRIHSAPRCISARNGAGTF